VVTLASSLPPRGLSQRLALILVTCALGCAPSQSFRPAVSPGGSNQHELGLAVSTVGARPYVVEPARRLAQAWWTERLGRRWWLSTIVGFDTEAVLGGVAFRLDVLRTRWLVAAAEAEAGFLWAGVAAPVGVRIAELGALYCTPRLGNWGPALTPFLPCGAEAKLMEGLVLRAELQLSWADFEYYNRRVHWGLGVAHQW
jgi:hypothetical protein